MNINLILGIVLFAWSATALSAYSEAENGQLAAINEKGFKEVKSALNKLKKSTDRQISNNPDRKALILALKDSWGKTIAKKCQLETVDSRGTDAEIAEVNRCLVKNYQDEINYFDTLLP